MKKACFFTNPFFLHDEIFNEKNAVLNQNNQLEPYRRLQAEYRRLGYDLRTQDIHKPAESEVVLYADMPASLPPPEAKSKSFLLLLETWLIRPDNWSPQKHKRFQKVFTYSEEHLRKGSPYSRFFVPQPMPWPSSTIGFPQREKLCCMISGGKLSLHPKELYSERIRWIRWFENNHPEDFDLYGAGWDRMWMTGPLYVRALNKLPFWRKLLYPPMKSYKGRVADKYDVMSKYKFAICLENAKGIEGYITEKIFDCFFAGCIPIYWGAPDIGEKVPSDCFIDLRKFATKEDVYRYISGLSEAEFAGYQSRIRDFLSSESFAPFTSEHFVKNVVQNTIGR